MLCDTTIVNKCEIYFITTGFSEISFSVHSYPLYIAWFTGQCDCKKYVIKLLYKFMCTHTDGMLLIQHNMIAILYNCLAIY